MSKNNKNIIIWEKWIDPLLIDSEENYEDILEDSETEKEDKLYKPTKSHIIVTPYGVIPYNELNACGKIFNFWNGHTNFTISSTVLSIIESVEGVETLDVFTRYRFRIGIGKAFTDSDVMRVINNQIYDFLESA